MRTLDSHTSRGPAVIDSTTPPPTPTKPREVRTPDSHANRQRAGFGKPYLERLARDLPDDMSGAPRAISGAGRARLMSATQIV